MATAEVAMKMPTIETAICMLNVRAIDITLNVYVKRKLATTLSAPPTSTNFQSILGI
jgi:hypothetical protein